MKQNKQQKEQHQKHGNHDNHKQGLQSINRDVYISACVEIREGRSQEVFWYFPIKANKLCD